MMTPKVDGSTVIRYDDIPTRATLGSKNRNQPKACRIRFVTRGENMYRVAFVWSDMWVMADTGEPADALTQNVIFQVRAKHYARESDFEGYARREDEEGSEYPS